jgi:hypothetical protein
VSSIKTMFRMVLIISQKIYNQFQGVQKLTVDHQKIINKLVDAVNSQIVSFHSFPYIWSSCY